MNLEQLRRTYYKDPTFRAVVSHLEMMIEQMRMSPSEVREAAMLAVFNVEQRNPPKPIVIERGN